MAPETDPKAGTPAAEVKAQREAHWREVLERWKASGLPKTQFARQEGISPDVLGWWNAQIRKRDRVRRRVSRAAPRRRSATSRRTSFVPVRVVESTPQPAPAAIEMLAGGRTIRIRPGFDAETLRRLVAVLEDRP